MTVSWLHSKPTPPAVPAETLTLRIASAAFAVTYTAACPACGEDAQWTGQQRNQGAAITVDCPCWMAP